MFQFTYLINIRSLVVERYILWWQIQNIHYGIPDGTTATGGSSIDIRIEDSAESI